MISVMQYLFAMSETAWERGYGIIAKTAVFALTIHWVLLPILMVRSPIQLALAAYVFSRSRLPEAASVELRPAIQGTVSNKYRRRPRMSYRPTS